MKQPLTAKQICKKTGIPVDTCSYVLGRFAVKGLVVCLNPKARNSRLYYVTDLGSDCQSHLHQGVPETWHDFPSVDWEVYGWACYNHRATVIRVLMQSMQPSEIKRVLRVHKLGVKISANNIRDVVKLFLEKGIVQKVFVRKKAHPQYELTKLGTKLQRLLSQAEMPL